MTKKNKRVVITLLAVCCVIISVWTIMRYNARRELVEQFNSDLAQRFNDIMERTYPLIDNYAKAMVDRADLRKRAGLSEQECQAVVSAGIPITARKQEDGTVTVVFHKDNAEKVNQALDSIKTQAMKR